MNSAKYNRRVEIQEIQSTRDSDGQWVDTWVTTRKIWAGQEDKGGDEYFEAKAANATRTVLWTTRYDKQLYKDGEGKRLFYDGQSYDIKNVADKKGLRKEIEIITEAVVSS